MEAAGAYVIVPGSDADGETDGEDSFFDLVFESPDRVAGDAARKDFRLVESPRDVLLGKSGPSSAKASSPVTLLRFFTFNFRKSSKCEKKMSGDDSSSKSAIIDESDRLSVKCGAEETPAAVVVGDKSLRSQLLRETSDGEAYSPEKMSSRDAVSKYLKLIKPLYLIKVWRRQSAKPKLTDSSTASSSPATAHVRLSPMKFSEGSRSGSFKIAAKRLVKSRSASAAVGVPPLQARRRDESLVEQHEDGIQGAVLYCKKSYNSSSSREISQLFRSSSDPSHEKSEQQGRHSCEVPIRCSI